MSTHKYYNENALIFFESTINSDMSSLYEKFMKYLKPAVHILDLGCGSGRDSLYFKKKGFLVNAIDASVELAKLAEEHAGIKVQVLDMLEMDFEDQFDAIWASASILHIPKNKIDTILFKCYCALKDEGILYASFKHGDKEEVKEGRFFNFYDMDSFRDIMERNNFEVLELWNSSDVRPGRENEMWTNGICRKRR